MSNHSHINVVCLRTGTKYSVDYVYKLASMFKRHLQTPHTFHCFTDRPEDFKPTKITRMGIVLLPTIVDLQGWWGKTGFFHPLIGEQFEHKNSPMLYMDLDMVICKDIDSMLPPLENPFPIEDVFIIIRQWKTLKKVSRYGAINQGYNSSMMFWGAAGNRPDVFTKLTLAKVEHWRGDQDWIMDAYPHEVVWPDCMFCPAEQLGKNLPIPEKVRVVLCNKTENHILVRNGCSWLEGLWQ